MPRFRTISCLVGMSCVFICAGFAEAAHPFHVSIAQVKHNAESRSLEVALRVHPNDLETTLRRRTGKPIDLDKTENVDKLIVEYLAEVFVIKPAEGKIPKLKWVGKQVDVKHAWLFFESPAPDGVVGVKFSNRIFFETLSDQVNTITLTDGDFKKSINCTKNRPGAVIREAD